jgi:hypothetical protein
VINFCVARAATPSAISYQTSSRQHVPVRSAQSARLHFIRSPSKQFFCIPFPTTLCVALNDGITLPVPSRLQQRPIPPHLVRPSQCTLQLFPGQGRADHLLLALLLKYSGQRCYLVCLPVPGAPPTVLYHITADRIKYKAIPVAQMEHTFDCSMSSSDQHKGDSSVDQAGPPVHHGW